MAEKKRKAGGRPFEKGHDPRRGQGGRAGAPNIGRPPNLIRAALRASFEERLRILESIADDGKCSPSDRIRALELLAKYGLGATFTQTDGEGNAVPISGVEVLIVDPAASDTPAE